jgi:hypothetical protein
MAASWTLLEELPHDGGRVTASTWEEYPIATCRDTPREIDVVFTSDDTTPSSGMGEPASVPTAAAIANAVFAACGARVRRLPLRPGAVRRAKGVPRTKFGAASRDTRSVERHRRWLDARDGDDGWKHRAPSQRDTVPFPGAESRASVPSWRRTKA